MRENAGHLKGFGVDRCPVAHNKHNNGLDDWNTVGKFSGGTGQETPIDSEGGSAKSENNKAANPAKHPPFQFDRLPSDVRIVHIIQNL